MHCKYIHPQQVVSQRAEFFSEKFEQLKNYHKKPETFYASMKITDNFSESYIMKVVGNIVKDLDVTTQKSRLVSSLALINRYMNGSHMSLSLCEELVEIRNALRKKETHDP